MNLSWQYVRLLLHAQHYCSDEDKNRNPFLQNQDSKVGRVSWWMVVVVVEGEGGVAILCIWLLLTRSLVACWRYCPCKLEPAQYHCHFSITMIFISMLVIWVNISKNNIFEAIWWSVHQLFNARGRCDHATVLSTIAPFIKKNEERLKRFTRNIWMWWQRHIAPDNSHVLIRFSKPLFACQAIK